MASGEADESPLDADRAPSEKLREAPFAAGDPPAWPGKAA